MLVLDLQADGIGGFISALFTVTPLSIFAQNNVSALTSVTIAATVNELDCLILYFREWYVHIGIFSWYRARVDVNDHISRLLSLGALTEQPVDGVVLF